MFPEDTAGTCWWMAGGRWPCRAQGDDRAPARDVKDPEETLNMRLMGEVSQRTQEHSVWTSIFKHYIPVDNKLLERGSGLICIFYL